MRTQAQVNMEVNESVQKKSNQGGNNFKRTWGLKFAINTKRWTQPEKSLVLKLLLCFNSNTQHPYTTPGNKYILIINNTFNYIFTSSWQLISGLTAIFIFFRYTFYGLYVEEQRFFKIFGED